jgi:sugar phosphate isomerase/epimerase
LTAWILGIGFIQLNLTFFEEFKFMPIPISIQLYTVREAIAKDGIQSVLKNIADMGYPNVEGYPIGGVDIHDYKKALDGAGLKQPSMHCGLLDSSKWNQIEDEATLIGYKHIVSSTPKNEFTTPESIRIISDKFAAAVNHFSPKGYTVSLHNHWWEFDGPNRGDLLLELNPKLHMEFDIYWVKTGGADPAELIQRYARRTKLLHIKDGPANDPQANMVAVGQGSVDIPSAVRAGEMAGVEYLVVELDRCGTDMMTAVRESYNYLTQRSLASGNR